MLARRGGGTFNVQDRALYRIADFWRVGLFLAEAIQPHHFGALARLCRRVLIFRGSNWTRCGNRQGGRRRGGRNRGKVGCRCLGGIGRIELQAELH
jgi:hypothetical protein